MLLCVAAVLYNDWLLQFFVTTGLSQTDSYVSETFAADQPHRLLFGIVELACAVVLVAAAVLAACSIPRGPARAGWSAVALLGGCSVLDVLLPMGCAPSVEHGCPPDNIQHTATSGLVEFTLFLSMALFGLAARRGGPGRAASVAGRWAPYVMPVSMASAIATVGPYLGYPGGQGIAQRIHLVSVAAWFVLLAAEARSSGAVHPHRESGAAPGRGRDTDREAGLVPAGPADPRPDAPSVPVRDRPAPRGRLPGGE